MKQIFLFGGVKIVFFKQLPLNIKRKFESLYHSIDGEKPLSIVTAVVSFFGRQTFRLIQLFSMI